MKLFWKGKDGGTESRVTGYWLIEWKRLFSIVLLRFDGKSREAFHTHAFNSMSWLLKGKLLEEFIDGKGHYIMPSLRPIWTPRSCFHKVDSKGVSWVLSFRGPWTKTWEEFLPNEHRYRTLTNGRAEVV
jgi:hypothetical protein